MENKNVLIGAVLIILVALLAFNLDITGQATKINAKVYVSPSIIDAGDIVEITIIPGTNGVEKEYAVYCNGLRRETKGYCELDPNEMDARTCFSKQTINYRTLNDEDSGDCYVEFTTLSKFDNVDSKVRGYFTIR